MERGGDQGDGVVVDVFVVAVAPQRVVAGGGSRFDGPQSLPFGNEGTVVVDQPQGVVRCDDDVRRFQVAVRPRLGEQFGGHRLECRGQDSEAAGVAVVQRPPDFVVERVAVGPFGDQQVVPCPAVGDVEVNLFGQVAGGAAQRRGVAFEGGVEFGRLRARVEVAFQGKAPAVDCGSEDDRAASRGEAEFVACVAFADGGSERAEAPVGGVQRFAEGGKGGQVHGLAGLWG